MTHVWTHDRSHSSSAARRLVLGLLGAVSLAIGATGALAASVEKSSYGATKAGEAVDVYTLQNGTAPAFKWICYGGIITDIDVPDRWGRVNVVPGKNLADYETKIPILAR
jgi:aldose 1-epimerase